MAKIKIISNPYNSEIHFQEWNESSNTYEDICYDTKPDSKLICEKLAKAFLPFKVTEIVDRILAEYYTEIDANPVYIVFEGNDDEYSDLCFVCEEEAYREKVVLEKSESYIENAREILPEIVGVFDELYDLVSRSVRDEEKMIREINKFKEASNRIIPICVMGTYSAGKSTFINALIGSEILPSSDQPMTAKIYKISKSTHGRKAKIRFEYDGKPVCLEFYEEKYIGDEGFVGNAVADEIESQIEAITEKDLVRNVNKALEVINSSAESEERLSEIIEITVPFRAGILDESPKDYVIFDTPGSNSESNEKHLEVLKKAMANLSNGLPIYISEYQALDTKDNAELYKVIASMKELDDRFTLIIVNKADQARLPKEGFNHDSETKILSQAVPKRMFAGGMYFVSSIMGLGAKNGGDFIDEYYSEVYETQKHNYTDSTSKFYKVLYQYNITAEQMKRKQVVEAENCSNPVYANSGLQTIEREVEVFADKYSSYNKCQQSRLFLDNIIRITTDEIEQTKQECEETKIRLGEALEKEKKELIERLNGKKTELEESYILNHPDCRETLLADTKYIITSEELETQRKQIELGKASERDYDAQNQDAKEKRDAIGHDFAQNIKSVLKSHSLESVKESGKELFSGLATDFKESEASRKKRKEMAKDIERATTDEVLDIVIDRFDNRIIDAKTFIEDDSKKYWTQKTIEVREILAQIVTNSSALTEKERETLAQIIMEYKDLTFKNFGKDVFDREKLVHGFKLGALKFGAVDSLNIDRIKKKYMISIKEKVDELFVKSKTSHETSFRLWIEDLMKQIKDNIIEFNPTLRSLNRIIEEKTEEIIELEGRQTIIEQDKEKIRLMMEWK